MEFSHTHFREGRDFQEWLVNTRTRVISESTVIHFLHVSGYSVFFTVRENLVCSSTLGASRTFSSFYQCHNCIIWKWVCIGRHWRRDDRVVASMSTAAGKWRPSRLFFLSLTRNLPKKGLRLLTYAWTMMASSTKRAPKDHKRHGEGKWQDCKWLETFH